MERYLTEEEQRRLLNAAKRIHDPLAQRDYHLISLLLLSGMRVGECCQISIGQAKDAVRTGALFIPKEHRKGGKRDHRVPLTTALRTHFSWLIAMAGGAQADAPLIAGRDGGPITTRAVQLRFKHWSHEAGLADEVSPHWLRHSRAMNIMSSSSAKDPRGIVKHVLGHASIASTGIYTECSKEDVRSALETIDRTETRRPSLAQLRKQYAEARP